MADRKTCYGTMFPDLDKLELNRLQRGKAFAALVESKGIGVSSRRATVIGDGWNDCTTCESYRDCYDLSVGKLLLETALHQRA